MHTQAWHVDAKDPHLLRHIADSWYAAKGVRLDAGETAAIARQLTYNIKRLFDKKYPELRARDFIPVNYEVPEGAEAWSEKGFDWAGMAKIIDSFADDLPLVDIMAEEVLHKPKYAGDAYMYTLEDLARQAFSGIQVDNKRAFAAKRAWENLVEQLGAIGNAAANIPGFLTNANVTVLTAAGGNINGAWATATSQQIYSDLMIMTSTMVSTTKGVFKPDTMLLPISSYEIVMTKPFSDLDPTPVGMVFLKNNPHIRNIDQWAFLETADAAGTGPRAVVYKRDSEILELMIMKEFTQLPPKQKALAFLIDCYGVIGGVAIHYPLGIEYVDGL
jgi:hypothetical protein